MNIFSDEAIHQLEEIFQRKHSETFAAIIQGQDGQGLSIGLAHVAFSQLRGTFWPHYQSPQDIDPATPATASLSDGRILKLQKFYRCEIGVTLHYHFRFDFLT